MAVERWLIEELKRGKDRVNEGGTLGKQESEREKGKSFMRHGKRGERRREGELMPVVGLNRRTPCSL